MQCALLSSEQSEEARRDCLRTNEVSTEREIFPHKKIRKIPHSRPKVGKFDRRELSFDRRELSFDRQRVIIQIRFRSHMIMPTAYDNSASPHMIIKFTSEFDITP